MNDHIPSSYWQETAPLLTLSETIPTTADVVVIGGGIAGIATSYWLARSGLSPVLLERTAPAYGATGRNGGIISIGLAESYPSAISRLGQDVARQVLQLTLENRALVRQVIAEESIQCDYRETGHLILAIKPNQLEELLQSVTSLRNEGINTQLLDRQALRDYIHTPLSDEIIGGRYTQQTSLLHSAKFINGLANAAQRLGAKMHAASVLKLDVDNNKVQIHTAQGTIKAQIVIVAVNAWASELLYDLAPFITPVRGQALSYAPIHPVFTTGISVDITDTEEYWQQTADGAIVLGGCRSIAPGKDVNVYTSRPTEDVQGALEKVIPRLFPSLQRLHVTHRWAGLMAFTPDYLPIVDRVPSLPGTWFAGGFSGHGMAYSMRLGQILADSIMKNVNSDLLHPFRLNRPTLMSS